MIYIVAVSMAEQHALPEFETSSTNFQRKQLENGNKPVCNGASKYHGAAAAKAEARKTNDYKSKVDGIQTQLIPAAFELNGRRGDGLLLLFKTIVALATKKSEMITAYLRRTGNDDYPLWQEQR